MGLDMYLTRRTYIGAEYAHNKITGTIQLFADGKEIKINLDKITYIEESAGYWRKANQIHAWFVTNIQNGIDECEEHYVPMKMLLELKSLCERALHTSDPTLLPPREGFFFGSYDIDEYYWDDLRKTVAIISKIDPEDESQYHYRSSW